MCLTTSGKGLYHNLRDWRFEFCGDFKIMEQDKERALEAFRLFADKNLYYKLYSWDFNANGGFKISQKDYDIALSAFKQLGEKEEMERMSKSIKNSF